MALMLMLMLMLCSSDRRVEEPSEPAIVDLESGGSEAEAAGVNDGVSAGVNEDGSAGESGLAEGSARELRVLAHAAWERLTFDPIRDAGPPDALEPRLLGEFQLTYYWMTREVDVSEEATVPDVQLFDRHCQPLTMVSRGFADQLALEGTGRLRDGRTINVAGDCECATADTPCFFVVGRKKRWGVGVGKRPLSPYRSVAVDPGTIEIGSRLYIPELDGLTMPGRRPYGGFVHDGCVVADDTGGRVDSSQLDLFMALEVHYQSFDRRHRLKRVTVYDGASRCQEPDAEGVPAHRNAT